MTSEDPVAPDAGAASKLATTAVLILLALTLVLVALSFPAGIYAVFHGGLSNSAPPLSYGSLVLTYLWIGPWPVVSPFGVPLGGLFLSLTVIYAAFFLLGFAQQRRPLEAIRESFHTGVGSLLGSPFILIIVAIGFLNFSAVIISAISEAAAGTVGNPFSNVDPLLELGSLTFAPLREEIGFRVILIGLVAFVLSIGRPSREALKALWRPSTAYEGLVVGGATSVIIWLATAASAATFGVCHITCGGGGGWNWSKLPEATWGGVVLGYLYVKYGLHVAVLTHWGVDYLGSVFSFFGQAAYGVPVTSNNEYLGQYLVDFDMVLLFGVASFILVLYLGVTKFVQRRRARSLGLVDKGLQPGGGLQP